MRRILILFLAMTPLAACSYDTTGLADAMEEGFSPGYLSVEADTVRALEAGGRWFESGGPD